MRLLDRLRFGSDVDPDLPVLARYARGERVRVHVKRLPCPDPEVTLNTGGRLLDGNGFYDWIGRVIEVTTSPVNPPQWLFWALAHELGHHLDFKFNRNELVLAATVAAEFTPRRTYAEKRAWDNAISLVRTMCGGREMDSLEFEFMRACLTTYDAGYCP